MKRASTDGTPHVLEETENGTGRSHTGSGSLKKRRIASPKANENISTDNIRVDADAKGPYALTRAKASLKRHRTPDVDEANNESDYAESHDTDSDRTLHSDTDDDDDDDEWEKNDSEEKDLFLKNSKSTKENIRAGVLLHTATHETYSDCTLYSDSDKKESDTNDSEEEEEVDLFQKSITIKDKIRDDTVPLSCRKGHARETSAFDRFEFKSAADSTSVYETVRETENALRDMVLDVNRINEWPQRDINVNFYSRLLPIFIKSHLLLVDLISIPAEFAHTVLKDQGVRYFFTFENIRVFNLDNATLLLDHRYKKSGTVYSDYIMKVVARPVNTTVATFPRVLTTETNVFAGSREDSVPSRHFVRSYVLRPNFSLTRPAAPGDRSHLVEHHLSESVPSTFWWNVYDPSIPESGDFTLRIYESVRERPVIVDFLFLLGDTDDKDDSNVAVNRIKNRAKWEPVDNKDPTERASITIHMMLCFGFRILSFGMLCEYPKNATGDWIKQQNGEDNVRRHAYAAKRRRQMNTFKYANTHGSGIKKRAVMRIIYTLDTTESTNRFFRIMSTHEQTMRHRVLRSRLFYKTKIPRDLVGGSYVYPNNSLYMVLGSCNMLYTAREMSVCTASLAESLLEKLDDQSREDFDDVLTPHEKKGKKRNLKSINSKKEKCSDTSRGKQSLSPHSSPPTEQISLQRTAVPFRSVSENAPAEPAAHGDGGAKPSKAKRCRRTLAKDTTVLKSGGSVSTTSKNRTHPTKTCNVLPVKNIGSSLNERKKSKKPLSLSPAPLSHSTSMRGESFAFGR